MVATNTLLIKHLPSLFNDSDKKEFLKHFGAKEVKCITSKVNKYNVVFARFENENIAENVLHRLHQINILGSYLSVEFARNKNVDSEPPNQNIGLTDTKEEKENERMYKQFMEKLNSWHCGVDFRQPVPSHLKYQYPPPNVQTLVNIVKVLATVPKFYTQVLHLMNKMNLPCPFGKDILPDLDLNIYPVHKEREEMVSVLEEPDKSNEPEEQSETSDSEISTDEESKQQKETIPEQFKVRKKSKIKVPKFVRPAPAAPQPSKEKKKKTLFEEVFEKVPDEKETKKIKLSHPVQEVMKPVEVRTDVGGFGYIHPVKKAEESEPPKDLRDEREEERLEKEEVVCITEAELAGNRIPEKDRSVLPVFKNYAEGAPTCRLYIKNLAKTVTDEDLRFIYMRYVPAVIEDEPNMFDIKLMKEGRMKGQAFVTLQTVELARKALKETNGYILKDKPLVVQFARSATK